MEWAHRVLGRVLGLAFVAPLAYFAITKKIPKPLSGRLGAMALLIGAQGALGWYMVKSGLDDALLEQPGAIPRVSQYRLAAHLGLAFVLYAGMFSTGLSIIKDWKYVHSATDIWNGLKPHVFSTFSKHPAAMRLKLFAQILTGLVFLTAMSGERCHHTASQIFTSLRCLCCWTGCWTAIQRVSSDGRSLGAPCG